MSSKVAVPLSSFRVAFHIFFCVTLITISPASAEHAPTRLRAKAISGSEVRVTWKDKTRREEGFRIARSLNPNAGFEVIGTVRRGVTFYIDSGLEPNTKYFYRVCAFRDDRETAWSGVDPATTHDIAHQPCAFALSATSASVDAVGSAGSIILSASASDCAWTADSNEDWVQFTSSDDGLGDGELGYLVAANTDPVPRTATLNIAGQPFTITQTGAPVPPPVPAPVPPPVPEPVPEPVPPPVPPAVPSLSVVLTSPLIGADVRGPVALSADVNVFVAPSPAADSLVARSAEVAANPDLIRVEFYRDDDILLSTVTAAPYTLEMDTASLPNGPHTFFAVAYDSSGQRVSSAPVIVSVNNAPPSDPGGLTAQLVSTSEVGLAWQDNSNNETGFKLERSDTSDFSLTTTILMGADLTSHTDKGLDGGTQYFYRIKAYSENWGDSGYTLTASATTPAAPPAAPSDLSATAVSSRQINLNWADRSSNETFFQIERAASSTGPWTQVAVVESGITALSDSSVTAATTYHYRVRAYSPAGESDNSNVASASTPVSVPAAPTELSASAVSGSQIDLHWTDASSDETGFRVERSSALTGPWTPIATVTEGATSSTDNSLTAGTLCYYRVRSFNSGGDSENSNVASASTLGSRPAAPSGLSATAVSGSQIDLRWTDASSDETGFRVERSSALTGPWTPIATVTEGATSSTDNSLTAGTLCYYRVRSFNSVGESDNSNVASASTLGSQPAAPSGLSATAVSASQIDLSWTDRSDSEEGFQLENAPTASGPWAQVATVGAGVSQFNHTGLSAQTTLTYRVRATSAAGDSDYSNTASATTPAAQATRIDFGPGELAGTVTTAMLCERSGMAGSWGNPGVLWMQRDSGNPNQVFAVNHEGKVLASYALTGAVNHDWEAIAMGSGPEPGQGYLYVWDNRSREADGIIYRIKEPIVSEDPSDPPSAGAVRTYTISEVDAFKISMLDANGDHRAFGCESMMIDPTTGDLFLTEKAYSGTTCALAWRANFASLTDDGPTYSIQEIKRYPILEITSADISRSGRFIALTRHHTVNVWVREEGQSVKDVLLSQPVSPITVTGPNFGEALAFSGDEDGFYATPEGVPNACGNQDGRLWFHPKIEVPINPR